MRNDVAVLFALATVGFAVVLNHCAVCKGLCAVEFSHTGGHRCLYSCAQNVSADNAAMHAPLRTRA